MKTWIPLLLLISSCVFSHDLFARTQADEPVALVEEVAGFIFSDITQNLEVYSANPEGLQALVRTNLIPLLDITYASRLILGRAGRGVEAEKIDEFASTMTELLIDRYAMALLHFNSELELQVLPQRGELNEKITRVRTRVKLTNGKEAPVDYAFHKTDDGWKAFDVIIEGISYITTYRSQIMPEVEANGIDSVIQRLSKGELELSD